jgi:hypothetical protein
MGVFKKLSGNDVRVTPIQVKFSQTSTVTNPSGSSFDINTKLNRSDIGANTGLSNPALVYASARQLFYGAFISQNYISSGSIFDNATIGTVTNTSTGVFSRFDPSFQGSFTYRRHFPVGADKTIRVTSIPTKEFGESIVAGTMKYGSLTDDANGNLIDGDGNVEGHVFYDQGVIITVGDDGDGDSPAVDTSPDYSGSYTIYSTQYKCTSSPNEFNYSLNPTLLSASNVDYDPAIIDSPDFMPYVTTIGLYNENQELIMVAKLGQPVQLNPFTDTNFIIRLDR